MNGCLEVSGPSLLRTKGKERPDLWQTNTTRSHADQGLCFLLLLSFYGLSLLQITISKSVSMEKNKKTHICVVVVSQAATDKHFDRHILPRFYSNSVKKRHIKAKQPKPRKGHGENTEFFSAYPYLRPAPPPTQVTLLERPNKTKGPSSIKSSPLSSLSHLSSIDLSHSSPPI